MSVSNSKRWTETHPNPSATARSKVTLPSGNGSMPISHPPANISVIMPAFNTSKYIAASIESVLAQTFPSWHLIIVDDGSVDDTGVIADAFAASDSRIRVIHQPNAGIAAARNIGLRELHPYSEYVAFLDSDDVWEADALGTLHELLDQNLTAIGAHGCWRYIDPDGRPVREKGAATAPSRRRALDGRRLRVLSESAPTTFECLAYGNCIPTCGQLVRRAAIEKAGLFDSAFKVASDWEFWLRLTLHGQYLFANKVLYNYRQHGSSITKDSKRKNCQMYLVRRKLYENPKLTKQQRSAVLWGYRYYELYRAKVAVFQGIGCLKRGRVGRCFEAFGRMLGHCVRATLSP